MPVKIASARQNPGVVEPDNARPAALNAADNAVAAGVDAINFLGVGPEIDQGFLRQLVRPQPASNPPRD